MCTEQEHARLRLINRYVILQPIEAIHGAFCEPTVDYFATSTRRDKQIRIAAGELVTPTPRPDHTYGHAARISIIFNVQFN